LPAGTYQVHDHLRLAFSLDKLNAKIAAEASSSAIASIKSETGLTSVLSVGSATVDFWIYKSSTQLAQVDIKSSSSLIDNFELMMTMTNYDQPVTVSAPPASQVNRKSCGDSRGSSATRPGAPARACSPVRRSVLVGRVPLRPTVRTWRRFSFVHREVAHDRCSAVHRLLARRHPVPGRPGPA
jgi:hypothetical protein